MGMIRWSQYDMEIVQRDGKSFMMISNFRSGEKYVEFVSYDQVVALRGRVAELESELAALAPDASGENE